MDNIYYFIFNEMPYELKKTFLTFLTFYVIYALIEIYVFSSILSDIINHLKNNTNVNSNNFRSLINKFLLFLILYTIFLLIYKYFEIKVMIAIKTNFREILLNLILQSNNNKYNDINYTRYATFITRLADKLYYSLMNIIIFILPLLITILIVSFFLLKYDYKIFIFFILINSLICYIYFNKYQIFKVNCINFEESIIEADSKQVEILSNFDKIIYRGFSDIEMNSYKNICSNIKDKGFKHYNTMLCNQINISFLVNFNIFIIIYYFIYYNKIENITFIITLLLIYRTRIETCTMKLSDILELISKVDIIQRNFSNLIPNYDLKKNIKFNNKKINYDIIKFENIYFKYPNTDKYIYQNLNLELNFNSSKLIGIYGNSGSGKSTLCKILLKIYELEKGNISINNINYNNIHNSILKKNITYINQNNKLFDNNIEYNLNYGCTDKNICNKNLSEILKSDNLKNIFNKNDINEIKKINAGFLGEKISGGQRQIINVLNGLIYPSKILILDEPTNNLDFKSKKELIDIIQKFKKYKKGIIIITHDKDLLNIFDRTININQIIA
jgi:ATP-binding cassette subfamily B protein